MKVKGRFLFRTAIVLACAVWGSAAAPQSARMGCAIEAVAGTSRHVVVCPGRIRIAAEAGARYSLLDRDQDGNADGVVLRRRALLLEVPAAGPGGGFVVVTPQAIAAVRGTKWAVDAASRSTSVFVVDGRVAVESPTSAARVVLGPGEGVDVERGAALVVKRWPRPRVAALLARLGE